MNALKLTKAAQEQEFLGQILSFLHMQTDEFMECITKGDSCYEQTIYTWILKLYKKGKSPQEAIALIYKARSLYLLRLQDISGFQNLLEEDHKYIN